MAPAKEEDLLSKLLSHLTTIKANSPKGIETIQKAKYKLKYEKCTSTSEKEIDDRYAGLVEKFAIKGHSELSKALADHKVELLKPSRIIHDSDINQNILKYDMIRLLLTLSSSLKQNYKYAPALGATIEKPMLSWQDVIKDDPLEGDHWQTWSEDSMSEDNLSDPEAFEVDEEVYNKKKMKSTASKQTSYVKPQEVDYIDRMNIDKRQDEEGLQNLLQQQYWRNDFQLKSDNSTNISLLTRPCQLSQALSRLIYSESERQVLKTITEANMIREVLGFLRGFSSILFEFEQDEFVVNERYIVQHLSQQALGHVLNDFSVYGTLLSEIRRLVTDVVQDSRYGQTSQAFAECIYRSLLDFDVMLGQLEAETNTLTEDPTRIISILKLKSVLDPTLSCFKTVHEIVVDIPFHEGSAREISTHLIGALYDRAFSAQSSGQVHIYETLLYVFQQTIIPFGRIMDEWITYGSLAADLQQEFYVSRNDHVSMQDSTFWMNGFSIQSVQVYNCPLFDPRIMSRVFFTGKAINLLSHIHKMQKKQVFLDFFRTANTPFDQIIKSNLSMRRPFIKSVKQKAKKPRINPDPFTTTFFPLIKNNTLLDTEDNESEEHSLPKDTGSLLNQGLMYCMESYIETPYYSTALDLNKVLHQYCELKEQLESLASVYLMLENDLMHSFCEAIFQQIDRGDLWFDQRRLNRTFTEACETSGYYETVYIETHDMDGTVEAVTPASYLEYIEFKVDIPWPLNNFIRIELLSSYSRILTFLFRLKRAKYVMEKKTLFRKTRAEKSDTRVMQFYALRMKILWFINAFWRYIMTTILHAETINFRDKLSISKDADEITALHTSYVRRIVDRCLLNDKASGIKKAIINIMDMSERMMYLFVKYMEPEYLEDTEIQEFNETLNVLEKDFNRTNEFITVSLTILGKKAGLPWFESLATSLSAK